VSAKAVKKVRPYPIEALITHDGKALPAHVVKLTTIGLMADLGANFMRVGEVCTISFEVPVLKLPVAANVVVVRTWDQFSVDMGLGNSSHKLAELHFKGMVPEHRENIVSFLKKINAPLRD
jgi:hypothetical protein